MGQGSHPRHARKPARLVYLAPALLGSADSRGLLQSLQRSRFNSRKSANISLRFSRTKVPTPGIFGRWLICCLQVSSAPTCGGTDYIREEDILDVWFDSGVSQAAVVERDPRLGGKADLYLEGSDQHRGWFHTPSSLLWQPAGAALRSVLTHGFTLDGRGGRCPSPWATSLRRRRSCKKFGAEILRLWVAAEDYREDVRISDEILNRLVEAYRRLRNTARFLISNLYDFDPGNRCRCREELDEMDRWILHEYAGRARPLPRGLRQLRVSHRLSYASIIFAASI